MSNTECAACLETKSSADFPRRKITLNCNHAPATCIECVRGSIQSQLDNKLWHDVSCPECPELFGIGDIEPFADAKKVEQYAEYFLHRTLNDASGFVWCPLGCSSGQIHTPGTQQPLVLCESCDRQWCFTHRVAWHVDYSCEEYDNFLANPVNFQNRAQRQAKLYEDEDEEARQLQRAIDDAEAMFQQALLGERQAAEERVRLEQARRERERRAAEARARQEAERRRKAAQAERERARRQAESDASEQAARRTTKPCPGCGVRIEKNGGCDHMFCISCNRHFSWTRGQVWHGH